MFISDLMSESLLRTLSGEQGFVARKPTMLALVSWPGRTEKFEIEIQIGAILQIYNTYPNIT